MGILRALLIEGCTTTVDIGRTGVNKISEEQIDSFILGVHDYIITHPLVMDEDEGYEHFHEFMHQRFYKYWSYMIKERNYN